MTLKERLVTVHEGAEREEVLALLHRHRIEKVLVVNDNSGPRGLITVKDIQNPTTILRTPAKTAGGCGRRGGGRGRWH